MQILIRRLFFALMLCCFFLGTSCKKFTKLNTHIEEAQEKKLAQRNLDPIEQYGSLFTEVQMQRIFVDGKTFVDCVPKYAPERIVKKYKNQRRQPSFDLKAFVLANFDLPRAPALAFTTDTTKSATEHINNLWPYLTREADRKHTPDSRIALPNNYIVPGGRFQEVYYWDSFFILLGLQHSEKHTLIENILDNFAYQINEYGFIPNGNRTYYLNRSQPPFYAEMIKLLAKIKDSSKTYLNYKKPLEKEYAFWMKNAENLNPGESKTRVVKMKDGSILNRYWSNSSTPRSESYYEDVMTAKEVPDRNPEEVYLNICAACESGWDFSSRWFSSPDDLGTIRTTEIIPVDLNALMYNMEQTLSTMRSLAGDEAGAEAMRKAARARKKALNNYLWDAKLGIYQDYDFEKHKVTGTLSLATVYPLYFGLASEKQALAVSKYLKTHFLKPGGLVTTQNSNGQQWDAPNGWPPHQWLAIRGLERYAHNDLASKIKERWLRLNEQVYKRTGKMLEKYNVVDTTLIAGGGEYPTQDGFGWTNGVYLDLKRNK